MIEIFLLILIVVFFTMNMGGSGMSPSSATLYGAKLIGHRKAVLWFTVFVSLGGILLGHNVVRTLGGRIIPSQYMDFDIALVILFSATFALFIVTLLWVPQSTSWATVFAISGAGLALGHLNYGVYFKIIPFWVILPLISFALTYFLYRIIYPPRQGNLYLYQTFFSHEKR